MVRKCFRYNLNMEKQASKRMEYYAEHKQTIHRVIHAVIMLYETEQNMYKHLDVQQYTWICVCRTCSCIDVFVDLCMSYLFLYRRLCGFVYVVLVLVSTSLWICVCPACSCIDVFVYLHMSYLYVYRFDALTINVSSIKVFSFSITWRSRAPALSPPVVQFPPFSQKSTTVNTLQISIQCRRFDVNTYSFVRVIRTRPNDQYERMLIIHVIEFRG